MSSTDLDGVAEAKAEVARIYRAKFREAQHCRQVQLYERAWEECLRREQAQAAERAAASLRAASEVQSASGRGVARGPRAGASAPGSASAVAHAPQQAEVQFEVHFDTFPGQELHLVGSCDCLGCWDVGRGVHMAWTIGNIWRAKVVFPAGAAWIEYKYVLRKGDGSVDWEGGSNHALELPSAGRFLRRIDHWGSSS